MKQKTHLPYWFLPVVVLLLFVLAACVRPVPPPDVTATPETVPPAVMPTLEAPIPMTPDMAYPVTDGTVTEPAPDPNAGMATAVPAAQVHTVQDGQTLDSIAVQYGVTTEELAIANNLTIASTLVAGQSLVVPAPGTAVVPPPEQPTQPEQPAPQPTGEQVHVVQPGENLFRISLNYGKNVNEVAAYNGITNPALIHPGQVIRIP